MILGVVCMLHLVQIGGFQSVTPLEAEATFTGKYTLYDFDSVDNRTKYDDDMSVELPLFMSMQGFI